MTTNEVIEHDQFLHVQNSDAASLPVSKFRKGEDAQKRSGLKAVFPGDVAQSVAGGNDTSTSSVILKPLTNEVLDNHQFIEVQNPEPAPLLSSTFMQDEDSKAILTGIVAQSTVVRNEKASASATRNSLAEFVSDKEDTKESNDRRCGTRPTVVLVPVADRSKRSSSSLSDNNVNNQTNTSTIMSLENSEPSDLSTLHNLSDADKKINTGTKAKLPGAVAETVTTTGIFKGNKYQHKITASSNMNANTKIWRDSATNKPGAVPESSKPSPTTKSSTSRNYRRHKKAAIGNQNNSDKSAIKALNNVGKNTTPVIVKSENSERFPLPDYSTVSHNPSTSDEQQSYDVAAPNESSPTNEPHYVSIEPSHAINTSQETADNEGLIVATLVDSDNDFATNVIVDAIAVEDKPIDDNQVPWYKNHRTLFVFGTLVISSVAIAAAVFFLLREGNSDEVLVFRSVPPSPFLSLIPTDPPTLMPSSFPFATPSIMPTSNPLSVLQTFYASTGGPSWKNTWDFSSGQFYCSFYGIICDELDQITRIDLRNNTLQGPFPSELGLLSSLITLSLRFNSITGKIPSELGLLVSLSFLDIDWNDITGTIPTELGMLSSVKRIELDGNDIVGTIPSELGALISLTYLDLDYNSITGTIPTELGLLSSLLWFDIGSNSIWGTIPSELGLLSSLSTVYLDDNFLTGTFPMELCELVNTTINYDESEISCSCVGSNYVFGTPCN